MEWRERVIRRLMVRYWEEGRGLEWKRVMGALKAMGFATKVNPKTGFEVLADRKWYRIYERLKKRWEKELRRRESVKALVETALAYGDVEMAKDLLERFSSYLLKEEEMRYRELVKRLRKDAEGFVLKTD
jgi:ferritin